MNVGKAVRRSFLVFCSFLLCFGGVCYGAHFEEQNMESLKDPAGDNITQDPNCEYEYLAMAVRNMGESNATVFTLASANGTGMVGNCTIDGGAGAFSKATLTLMIAPDGDDRIGDCVRIFYNGTSELQAEAEGAYEAAAGVSALETADPNSVSALVVFDDWLENNRDPARISLAPATYQNNRCRLLAIGPRLVMNGEQPFSDGAEGSVVARIGDKLVLEVGSVANVRGQGVGSAQAFSENVLQVRLVEDFGGPCNYPYPCEDAKPVPSLGFGGLTVLALLLGAAPLFVWRRRRKTE